MADPSATTCDGFLGGRLSILQPQRGYRAGVDPVLLAAAVTARPGQSVLELGCGAGVAALCLQARVGGLALTGLELQPDYAALARRNADANGVPMRVVEGDLARMPTELRAESFDHVLANPPYYRRAARTAAAQTGRETALGEATPLAAWIDAAVRRLAPRGVLTVIQRADRLHDLLTACDSRLGDVQVQPLAPRDGRAAELVLLRAVKGARGPFRLHAPLILHAGARHERDAESYREEIRAVLRDGKTLPTGWQEEKAMLN
ncbi:methyltransferase [Psychromarinibacter sp. C21-152]|uniref:Methyltransferase n=1 Tax=Psychromarinibacter sediminicola TaxID=3033385 RepID=A0AAE3T8S2_9RHOB|nr:methyltransferase domain-containing protein [Psychromarinibacter sediminicola]MDF0601028.1 methyltransferase [Psychromarinibacter sediminicola]